MPSLGLVSRINVLTAIRDHDLQGAAEFREALGFEEAGDEVLIERGKRYDARALLAYAYRKATGTVLDPDEISFGSLSILTDLDFTVASLAELNRPKAAPATRARTSTPRAPRATTSTRSKPEPEVKLCPRCFMQLSVVGNCDNCD
ncbi:MAG: hypothetical protein ACJ72O_09910 [Marmoricola sp.]